MKPKNRRIASTLSKPARPVEECLERRSVAAAESDLLDLGQGNPRERLFVDPGELTQVGEVAGAGGEEVAGRWESLIRVTTVPLGPTVTALTTRGPVMTRVTSPPATGHLRQLDLAVVLEQEEKRRAVVGEAGSVDAAIQGRGEHPGVASAGRDHRHVGLGVVDDLRTRGGLVGEQRAVRVPDRALSARGWRSAGSAPSSWRAR